eukprot:TsM_001193100 transcript=TsM_001193100 gene=TsM_001193100
MEKGCHSEASLHPEAHERWPKASPISEHALMNGMALSMQDAQAEGLPASGSCNAPAQRQRSTYRWMCRTCWRNPCLEVREARRSEQLAGRMLAHCALPGDRGLVEAEVATP